MSDGFAGPVPSCQVQCNNLLFAMPMPYAIGKAKPTQDAAREICSERGRGRNARRVHTAGHGLLEHRSLLPPRGRLPGRCRFRAAPSQNRESREVLAAAGFSLAMLSADWEEAAGTAFDAAVGSRASESEGAQHLEPVDLPAGCRNPSGGGSLHLKGDVTGCHLFVCRVSKFSPNLELMNISAKEERRSQPSLALRDHAAHGRNNLHQGH